MFIVIEIQKSADGVVSNIVNSYEARAEAESRYHAILSSAAVSGLPVHSAIIVSEEGFPIKYQCYKRD